MHILFVSSWDDSVQKEFTKPSSSQFSLSNRQQHMVYNQQAVAGL